MNITKEIKTSTCLFTFDDWWVDEWYKILDLLDAYDIKATFYLTFFGMCGFEMNSTRWDKLREIKANGHTIGFHSSSHFDAAGYIKQYGWAQYEKKEILAGLKLFNDNGFDIKHFSYPFGFCNDEINKKLKLYFNTLRGTERYMERIYYEKMVYAIDEIKEADLIHSFWFDKQLKEIKEAIAINTGKIFCCYTHMPDEEKLENFFNFCKRYKVQFYSMELLNKKDQKR